MAKDPRSQLAKRCPASQTQSANEAQKRSAFFSGLKKVSQFEGLNDLGLSVVGQGLRGLVGVSDAINKTNIIPTAMKNGVKSVMDAVDINLNSVELIKNFNPQVANRALGQAKSVYEMVTAGSFGLKDVARALPELQNLHTLIGKVYTPSSGAISKTIGLCGASPYAKDLISYAPKFKFLFVAQLIYNEPYQDWDFAANNTAFVVKTSSRPNVEFEYEEVNMYNFWTKIPKRTTYQPMNMRFYDDNKNNAMLFYTSYMRAMSPIANMGGSHRGGIDPELYQADSMNSEIGSYQSMGSDQPSYVPTRTYAASLGPLNDNAKNILSEIRLYHVFGYGASINIYHFYNPKITSFELDDLDMADNGNGNEMAFQFSYDGLYIEPTVDMQKFGVDEFAELSGERSGAVNPIRPIFGPDSEGPSIPGGMTSKEWTDTFTEQATAAVPSISTPGNVTGGWKNPDTNKIMPVHGNPSGLDGVFNFASQASSMLNQATGGSFNNAISNVTNQSIAGAKQATGLVSDAFKSTSGFIGSIFS